MIPKVMLRRERVAEGCIVHKFRRRPWSSDHHGCCRPLSELLWFHGGQALSLTLSQARAQGCFVLLWVPVSQAVGVPLLSECPSALIRSPEKTNGRGKAPCYFFHLGNFQCMPGCLPHAPACSAPSGTALCSLQPQALLILTSVAHGGLVGAQRAGRKTHWSGYFPTPPLFPPGPGQGLHSTSVRSFWAFCPHLLLILSLLPFAPWSWRLQWLPTVTSIVPTSVTRPFIKLSLRILWGATCLLLEPWAMSLGMRLWEWEGDVHHPHPVHLLGVTGCGVRQLANRHSTNMENVSGT